MKLCLLICPLLGIAGVCLAGSEPVLPQGWKPDLSAVEDAVTKYYERGGQQGFNLASARVFEIRDVELALIYLQLYAVLPPNRQARLRVEQGNWLKYRDAELDKVAPHDETRG